MEEGATWKITGFRFSNPEDLKTVIRAEIGVTGKFLSFVSESPSGVRRRAELSVHVESHDDQRRREIRGKVIRGLNENHAKHIIGLINRRLLNTERILKVARRETENGKETIIYKRRHTNSTVPFDDQQTPTMFNTGPRSTDTDITVVKEQPSEAPRNRRRTDQTP